MKLDRSLAIGAGPDRDAILYGSVIGLCDARGFEVIAEGIESSGQAEAVFVAGCQLAQGHFLGQPGPLESISSSTSTTYRLVAHSAHARPSRALRSAE